MIRCGVVLVALLGLATPQVAPAQTVRFGLQGVGLTYSEIDQGRRAEGGGLGGTFSVRWRRFLLDASGMGARLDPKGDGGGTSFDLLQGDVRLSYAFAPSFAVEIGGGRRAIDPEFATQDIGVVRLGVLSEIALNQLSTVWARGAYLVDSRFSGGGHGQWAVPWPRRFRVPADRPQGQGRRRPPPDGGGKAGARAGLLVGISRWLGAREAVFGSGYRVRSTPTTGTSQCASKISNRRCSSRSNLARSG